MSKRGVTLCMHAYVHCKEPVVQTLLTKMSLNHSFDLGKKIQYGRCVILFSSLLAASCYSFENKDDIDSGEFGHVQLAELTERLILR